MHPNPIFRKEPEQAMLAFARHRGFGALSINADPTPLISHIPFVIGGESNIADLHLVRSNPIARVTDAPVPAVIAVTGPDAYLSPDWYEVPDQVPTWNYVSVHLRGTLVPCPQEDLSTSLARLSAFFEARLLPKPPWTMDKMSDEALRKMMRMIRPFQFKIESVDGTWKLSQNKTDAVRARAADAVEASSIGQETAKLAALMREAMNQK